jgi:hypothetical protein
MTMERGRKLLIIHDTYPTKQILNIFKSPIVFVAKNDRILIDMWNDTYSEVYNIPVESPMANVEHDIEGFDSGSIYSDNPKLYFADDLPEILIGQSNMLKDAIEKQDVALMLQLMVNSSWENVNKILKYKSGWSDMTSPSLNYNDSEEMLKRNVNNPNYWCEQARMGIGI